MRLARSLLLLLAALAGTAPAGTLELVNGAVIPGTFLRIENDRVVWDAEHIGEIKVEQEVIARLDSPVPPGLRVHETELTAACAISARGPQLTFACADRAPVAAIWNEVGRAGRRREGSGKITASLTRERGNSYSDEYEVDAVAQWRRDRLRHRVEATVDYEDQREGTVEDEATLDYQLDWLQRNDWYVYGRTEYDRDRFSNVQESLIVGTGIGRAWAASENTQLLLQAGPDVGYFDLQSLGREREAGGNVQWRVDHETRLWRFDLTFFHTGEYGWLFRDGDLYQLETGSGIELPLIYGLIAEIRLDYDKSGVDIPGVDDTDTEWVFALGYKW